MNKETHPFINKFPLNKPYKYLVLGTFPPSQKLYSEKDRLFKVDYFYGNVASFWNLLQELYPNNKFIDIQNIIDWQNHYSIGISDTILSCKRKNKNSTKDSDLILEWADYNHGLKDYIIKNEKFIEKIIFTSSNNCNSALFNFKIIMGEFFIKIESKLVTNLPSPSGGSNGSFFNNNHETYGLKKDFFQFILNYTDESTISFVKQSFSDKTKANKGERVTRIPSGILKKFKIHMYRKIFPK